MGLMDRLRETLHLGEKHSQHSFQEEDRQRVGRESDPLPLGNREGERWLPDHHVQIQALVGMGEARQYGVSSQQVEIKAGVTAFTHENGGKLHLDTRGQFYSQEGRRIDREAAYEQRLLTPDLKCPFPEGNSQRVGEQSDQQLPLGNREGERWLPDHHVQIQALVGMREARQYGVSSQQIEVKEGVTTFTHVTDGSKLHLDTKGQFYSQEGKPIDREAAYEQRLPTAELKLAASLSHDSQQQSHGRKPVDDLTPLTFEQQGRPATLEFGRMSADEPQNERRQDPTEASPVRTNDADRDTFRHDRILEYGVGAHRMEQYEWKQTSGNIESFQNKETGKYLHADNEGRFYNQERKEISQGAAIQHAEPDRLVAPDSNGIHVPVATQALTVKVVRNDLTVAAAPAIDKAPVQEHSLSM